jgi:hypothetical protein
VLNTYCFSTVRVVTGTRHIVTLYLQGLPCSVQPDVSFPLSNPRVTVQQTLYICYWSVGGPLCPICAVFGSKYAFRNHIFTHALSQWFPTFLHTRTTFSTTYKLHTTSLYVTSQCHNCLNCFYATDEEQSRTTCLCATDHRLEATGLSNAKQLPKSLKVKMYKTVILRLFCMSMKLDSTD